MDAPAVAEFLKQNPQFFEEYADVIAEIFVPHPHGGHAIPIAERQIVTLREKNQDLEAKFKELVSYGTENDQISEKVHRSTLALFAAPDLETTLAVLYHSLKEDFGVPQVAARLWGRVPEQSYLPELAATSTEIRQYADQLGQPYCGPVAAFESREWFEEARFGMFIHRGIDSLLGDGEWVMQEHHLTGPRYEQLAAQFAPAHFDAA